MAITFFKTPQQSIIATACAHELNQDDLNKLCWLYSGATVEKEENLKGYYIGPRREMVTPWSTNAVEITQNMNIEGITRIEEYFPTPSADAEHDPMLQRLYKGLNQEIFTVNIEPAPIQQIEDLEAGLKQAQATGDWNRQMQLMAHQPELLSQRNEICKRLGNRVINL